MKILILDHSGMVGVFAAVKKYFFLCIMAKTNNGGNKMEKSEKKGEDGAK